MNRGPVRSVGGTSDFAGRSASAWGAAPDWIVALAEACDATSLTSTAKRVGYSAATLSQCLSNTYRGDIGRVEEMVRGSLLKMEVPCPILGEIGRDRCLQEQDEPFRATSAMRAQLYHACRGGCPFSKHTKETDHGQG